MASSNRHWPSMFKSKPCNSHHQWQHDINPSLMSSCQKSPHTSGIEERSPEPKPRWNPKPEQIRILEAIFNSGLVNPPRDEIRRIRTQLQEFGQVGDANVFYWFQNRKSRSKHKQRNIHNSKSVQTQSAPLVANTILTAPSSSSSSSSERTSPKNTEKVAAMNCFNVTDTSNSPTASVNQTFIQGHGDFLSEPFFFPAQPSHGTATFSHGFSCPELSNVVQVPDQVVGNCSGLLLTELLDQGDSRKEEEKMKQLSYTLSTTATTTATNAEIMSSTCATTATTSTGLINFNQTQGGVLAQAAAGKSMVYTNDTVFEVCVGPFNVRETFGDDVVLINSYGQILATNEWGVTLQSLQPGASYYLARTSHMFDYLTTC